MTQQEQAALQVTEQVFANTQGNLEQHTVMQKSLQTLKTSLEELDELRKPKPPRKPAK